MNFSIRAEFIIIDINKHTQARTIVLRDSIDLPTHKTTRKIPYSVLNSHYKIIGKHLKTIFKDL